MFVFGILVLVPSFLIGTIGLFFWISCPLVGLPYYFSSDKNHQRFFKHLSSKILNLSAEEGLKEILNTPPGKFVLSRCGIKADFLISRINNTGQISFPHEPFTNFSQYIRLYTASDIWSEAELKKHGIGFSDLESAADWWDEVYHSRTEADQDVLHISRPGLGLELLFGYTPQLNKYSVDLSAPRNFSSHLIGREKLVTQMERVLTSGNSLVLVGEPGVGKRTIILELAKKAMTGRLGSELLYKRFMELDYNFLLSDNLDINQKKNHLSQILKESSAAGNIVLVIKDIHRLTHSDVEGVDFTDMFESHLEKRKLKIIAISSQTDYERFLMTNYRLRKYLQPVETVAVSKETALQILFEYLFDKEKEHKLMFTIQAVRRILDGSEDYITDTPFPEKALELADQIISFCQKNNIVEVKADSVDQVLTDVTGISVSNLTNSQRQTLLDLESRLHQKLVGQNMAVTMIAKSLRSRDLGVKNSQRPVGSFLFLGPTGVGKTETAKTLAEIYYGSSDLILRFDMAEYAGPDGYSKLVGDSGQNTPGLLSVAIKKNPSSLLLLDEIEKAPREVFNLFLTILDEGQFSDPFGKKISCRHLFVIATSNAGAEFIRQQVNAGITGTDLQSKVLEEIQKKGFFSPEFINRFDGVIVYEPLTPADLVQIARLQLELLANRLKAQNIRLEITPGACEQIAKLGWEPQYGARPMRRLVDLEVGDLIATALLKGELNSGDKIRLDPLSDKPYFSIYVYPA